MARVPALPRLHVALLCCHYGTRHVVPSQNESLYLAVTTLGDRIKSGRAARMPTQMTTSGLCVLSAVGHSEHSRDPPLHSLASAADVACGNKRVLETACSVNTPVSAWGNTGVVPVHEGR